MIANTPVTTVLVDNGYNTQIEITGQYVSAQTAQNTIVLKANTLVGANTSQNCVVDVVQIQYNMATSTGWVSLEYVSANNANQTIAVLGKTSGGVLQGSMFNRLGANATGDLQLNLQALAANDSYTMLITLHKNSELSCWANVDLARPYN